MDESNVIFTGKVFRHVSHKKTFKPQLVSFQHHRIIARKNSVKLNCIALIVTLSAAACSGHKSADKKDSAAGSADTLSTTHADTVIKTDTIKRPPINLTPKSIPSVKKLPATQLLKKSA